MASAKKGTLALVGSGEFLPPIEELDRLLLARLSPLEKPRVVILPTASAPDGSGVPERWAKLGTAHFSRLGVEADAVMVLTRADAKQKDLAQQISEANFVYLSGGKPHYLLDTLQKTPCWEAITTVFDRGGVIAGCSAGAMVLAGYMVGRGLRFWQPIPTLGLVPSIAVIPHFDEVPGGISGISRWLFSGITVVGIDGSTALLGSVEDGWSVGGSGQVTVLAKNRAKRQYRAGEKVVLPYYE
jgi:cyanophycinase-like exopeptidase